jgi:hypothetical protein
MFDKGEKETLISSLRDRLLSTLDQVEKDKINRLIMKLKRHNTSGFITRKELADHFGVSQWKLFKDIMKNQQLVDELTDSGWNTYKSGFYPRHISIIQKHLGL